MTTTSPSMEEIFAVVFYEMRRIESEKPYSYSSTDIYDAFMESDPKNMPTPLGDVDLLERFGGEGQGEKYYIVFSLTDPDGQVRYFQLNGIYDSWAGVDWDEVEDFEVTPREKVITVWEPLESS